MRESKTIILNLTGCKYLGELHEKIRIAFDFPEWYGANWDAFWDLLNEPREYTVVKVYGLNQLPDDLKSSGKMLVDILQENKVYYENFMKRQSKFDYRFDYEIIS